MPLSHCTLNRRHGIKCRANAEPTGGVLKQDPQRANPHGDRSQVPSSSATSATAAASSKHSGEYRNVSSVANGVPRTVLNRPTYLKSPTPRKSSAKASVYESHDKATRGIPGESMPAVDATNPAHSNKAMPTATVDLRDGENSGLPFTLGTAPLSAVAGTTAI